MQNNPLPAGGGKGEMMKRISIIMIAVVFCASLANAQGITGYGIKGGLNIANLTGDDVEDTDPKMGLAIGGFLTYSINETFAIQPEIYYSMQGAKQEVPDEDMDIDIDYDYDYIQIPALVKFYIPIEASISPNLFLGPALGINVNDKFKIDFEGMEVETDANVKTLDFGLIFGAGVDVGPVTIDARYNLGLTATDDSEEEFDVKNSVISIMVGYSF